MARAGDSPCRIRRGAPRRQRRRRVGTSLACSRRYRRCPSGDGSARRRVCFPAPTREPSARRRSQGLPVDAVGPLPECRLADILTVPRDYDNWSITLVDWLLSVGEDYVPPDLVPVSDAGITGPGLIRAVGIADLAAMTEAAAAAGTPIAVNSPYRSYQ